jgi:hypothetical protein
MKTVLTAVLVLLLSGCASDSYNVVFDSNPQNAAVICNGRFLGYTPHTRWYPIAKITNGFPMSECIAQWSSGTSTRYRDVSASDVAKYPTGIGRIVQREPGGDYKTDAQSAERAHQQTQQLQQQQRIINQNDDRIPDAGIKMPTYCYKFGQMVTCNN